MRAHPSVVLRAVRMVSLRSVSERHHADGVDPRVRPWIRGSDPGSEARTRIGGSDPGFEAQIPDIRLGSSEPRLRSWDPRLGSSEPRPKTPDLRLGPGIRGPDPGSEAPSLGAEAPSPGPRLGSPDPRPAGRPGGPGDLKTMYQPLTGLEPCARPCPRTIVT